ncbi:hypothetical protein TVAG_365870 [Trichomonas vaginalis G3]|uniref:BRO1 domain-containing protein n=1 Tax=Trichomonas vaginalis (strain ATCC PRA-98 / G3) TaxID=412133 RepID=A2DHN1_TRIV3|nr:alix/aip1 like domains domain-containing protein [Trichomonas vaginalis G3]EAY20079.1 hypothetical protein TVAG_365870 [Trichomonas vaginalis G3]KAI5528032.1 alix/aip1 like domains domain-containing protein [Trichomonas vaginalis G3]|eukprot:XP_001581065.1 hypothetical protein [Trichomonas vaginalis G3]
MIPFPPTKNKSHETDAGINAAFGGSAPNVVELSHRVKSDVPDETAFQEYLPMLGVIANARVSTCYTSPFKTSDTFPSDEGMVEVINTLWNYLSYIHQKILSIDASSTDQLKEVKNYIQDAMAICDNLYKATSQCDHPFMTPQVSEYAKQYNKYIIAVWQVAIMQVSGKNKNFIARQALTAVNEIRECDNIARVMAEPMRSYFMPIATTTLAYYQGYAYFMKGSYHLNNKEFGIGIQCYRTACRYVNRQDAKIDFAPTIANALTSLKRACLTSKDAAEQQNRDIYLEKVPDGDPEGFKPLPLMQLTSNNELYIKHFFEEEMAMLEDDPWADPGASIPSGTPTSSQGGEQPPGDLPDDSISDDPWNSGGPKVVRDTNPWNSQPSQPPSYDIPQEDPFPVWEIAMQLKVKVTDMCRQLLNNPKWRAEAEKTLQMLGQGAAADNQIQNTINSFKRGDPNITHDYVEGYVQKAMQFYSNVEAKLKRMV